MRILTLEDQPFAVLPYWNAASGGGTVRAGLPVLRAVVDRLPQGLSGLLVASDLQGVADVVAGPRRGERVLLGEALAEWLDDADEVAMLPARGELGVLLAGDLYSAPGGNVRGATGDVRAVWQAFAARARFVAGVAGNHDLFGDGVAAERPLPRWQRSGVRGVRDADGLHAAQRFAERAGVSVLDAAVQDCAGLRVGGVSGIVGDPQKPNRRRSDDFLQTLSRVLEAEPEVVVLHEGPDDPDTRRRGNPDIRALLEVAAPGTLVLCGHCHWHEPLATLGQGCQVLNSDGRAVLLQAAG